MKKLVIASAVASVLASGAVVADTSMYGNIRLGLTNVSDLDMDSKKLIIGFKSEEDMGNGMTGYMHIELEHDNADVKSSGWNNDLSYVGLKGSFGAVQAGVQNDAAGFACGGTDLFTYEGAEACAVGSVNGELSNALAYMYGTGGFTLAVATTVDGSETQGGTNSLVGVQYATDVFSIGAQFTSFSEQMDWLGTGESTDAMVLGGTYTVSDMTIGFTYADNGGDGDNTTAWALALSAPVAGGTFAIGYDAGKALQVAGEDNNSLKLEFSKSLSKTFYAGAQFTTMDAADDDAIHVYMGKKF